MTVRIMYKKNMNVSTIDDAIIEDESRLMIVGVIQNEKKKEIRYTHAKQVIV